MFRSNSLLRKFLFILLALAVFGCGGSSPEETSSTSDTASSDSAASDSTASESSSKKTASGTITWTNTTFAVQGDIGITIEASGKTLTSLGFSSNFDGSSDTISNLNAPFSGNESSSVALVSNVYGPIDFTFNPSNNTFTATRQDSIRGSINYDGTYSVSGNTLTLTGTFSVPTFSATGPFTGSISGEAISSLFG